MSASKLLQYTGTFSLFSFMAYVGYLNFTHQVESNPIALFMLLVAVSKLPSKYELHPETLIGWLLILVSCIITYKFSHHLMIFESSDMFVFIMLSLVYFVGWWLAGLKKLQPGR